MDTPLDLMLVYCRYKIIVTKLLTLYCILQGVENSLSSNSLTLCSSRTLLCGVGCIPYTFNLSNNNEMKLMCLNEVCILCTFVLYENQFYTMFMKLDLSIPINPKIMDR